MTLAGRSVLVTGGAGFIGSHLVDRLAQEQPANLVVVDNLFLGKESNLEPAARAWPSLRFHRQDASDFDAMRTVMIGEGIEVVFDLSVVPLPTSLQHPRWTVDVNVGIATVLSELLRQGLYQTLIHFSSSEVYGTAQRVPMDEDHPLVPLTPYAASKAGADHVVLSYCRTFGIDAAVLRPFNTFGPRQNEGAYAGVIPNVVQRVLRGEPAVVTGDGEQTRDFTYVADVVEAALRVYDQRATRGRVLNVASGAEVSINVLVAQMLEILGNPVGVLHTDARPGDVLRHVGSCDRLSEMTGWRPGANFARGLAETVAWYRETLSQVHTGIHGD